jgi:hypothetical protein
MRRVREISPFEPYARERREALRLVRHIQALTLVVHELRQGEGKAAHLPAKEHELEQLRWRLAAVARRTATNGLDAAA